MPKHVSPESATGVVADPEHDRRCVGVLAELLRRERLYSSQLATWRAKLHREGEAGLEAKLPGRKPLKDAEDRHGGGLEGAGGRTWPVGKSGA